MVNEKYNTNLVKTKYVDDSKIIDHYAIIPTGQGLNNLNSLNPTALKVYEIIARRFLSIFYPPAVYQKLAIELLIGEEHFFANFKVLLEEGYYKVAGNPGKKRQEAKEAGNIIAGYLTGYGFNLNFAPVADVAMDGNETIGDRSFGNNAGETATMVAASVEGMQEGGVSVCRDLEAVMRIPMPEWQVRKRHWKIMRQQTFCLSRQVLMPEQSL